LFLEATSSPSPHTQKEKKKKKKKKAIPLFPKGEINLVFFFPRGNG
jgi:hypothetical protein